ncbi:hypothetical protein M9H77_18574 [Catharanthus roseus]|uniref:Uncharacterized protein n=1 Tax=Catharanthus roseus TaxID=4058 RepID=A0ACC0B7U4_CATRO|nr:hypothetical protein M9H77_18574 [Catharanthus roseus]
MRPSLWHFHSQFLNTRRRSSRVSFDLIFSYFLKSLVTKQDQKYGLRIAGQARQSLSPFPENGSNNSSIASISMNTRELIDVQVRDQLPKRCSCFFCSRS